MTCVVHVTKSWSPLAYLNGQSKLGVVVGELCKGRLTGRIEKTLGEGLLSKQLQDKRPPLVKD